MPVYKKNAWEYMSNQKDKTFDVIITDAMYDKPFTPEQMDEMRRVCKGHIITFCKEGLPLFKPDDYMYWIKPPSPKNTSKKMSSCVEWIIIECHGDTYNGSDMFWSNNHKVFTDVLIEKPIHPYQKPISLMERLVLLFSKKGDLVFDPFAGTGSTLEASKRHGRLAVGCEDNSAWSPQTQMDES